MTHKQLDPIMPKPALARILPFAAFMLFIAADETLAHLHYHGLIVVSDNLRTWLYLPRVVTIGILLFLFRSHYVEIVPRELRHVRNTLISFTIGVIIFALWINMDWNLISPVEPPSFNPNVIQSKASQWLVIIMRSTGAIIIVPIMEELFWRSFLLRYMINRDFMQVAIGRLTWSSFFITTILFGLEHHYMLAGIMAGLLLNLVYRITGSIAQCILCHTVANLCLTLYVLTTEQWHFW